MQESTGPNLEGLGGSTATATVTVTPVYHTPTVTDTTTLENTQSTSGLVITSNALDLGIITNFQITGISGGALYLSDGITPVTNGEFITVAERRRAHVHASDQFHRLGQLHGAGVC